MFLKFAQKYLLVKEKLFTGADDVIKNNTLKFRYKPSARICTIYCSNNGITSK